MIQFNYILNLLGFQGLNVEIIKCIESEDSFIIYMKPKAIPDDIKCKCGYDRYHIHAYTTRKIRSQNIGNKPCIIFFTSPRLICLKCNQTFSIPCPIAEKSRRLSNTLRSNLIQEFSKKKSFKDISIENNISETTAINEFKKEIHNYRCKLTRIVAIDEFKADTNLGKYAMIIGDPISGKILDILPERTLDYLLYYFQTIPKEEKKSVEYIVTDLYEPYRSLIKSELPYAIHIADRFHWIKLCSEGFNKIRIRVMNSYLKKHDNMKQETYKDNVKYAQQLKNNYKLLISNKCNYESWYYDQVAYIDNYGKNITLNDIIENLVNKDKDLEEAYSFLQELYRISKYSNQDNAEHNILDWCDNILNSEYLIPELKKVAYTYRSWIKEISNSYIIDKNTYKRITNGFIEGKNNFCKVMKRISFGVKDFDILRNKIILANNKTIEKK